MNKFGLLTIIIILSVSCSNMEDSMAKGQGMGNGNGGIQQGQNYGNIIGDSSKAINDMPSYELSDSQRASLLYMWEEEKVARDVYLAFGQQYSSQIFINIPRSEQQHMDAVRALIAKYNIPLIGNDTVGVFETQEFQDLYDHLFAKGEVSLKAALEVGKEIEVLDINDLQDRLNDATPDMELVYNNLLNASYKHLAAFERNLARP